MEYLFVPLAASLSNEDARCRAAAREALASLLRRSNHAPRAALAVGAMIASWLVSASAELRRTGSVALAVAAEVEAFPTSQLGELFGLTISAAKEQDNSEWKTVYYAVHAMEKVCRLLSPISRGGWRVNV